MKNINFTRGILLGVGLFTAATFMSSSVSAAPGDRRDVREARKDVKEARKDVRKEQRDLRRADTPGERREAIRDLRDAKQDLREEQRDLRKEQRDVRRPGYNNGYRPGNNNGYRPGYNNGYRPGNNGYRPGYNNGYRPGNSYRTIEGRVVNNLKGNDFIIRTNGGQQVRVIVPSGEPRGLSRGDLVRAYGSYDGGSFRASSANILRNG